MKKWNPSASYLLSGSCLLATLGCTPPKIVDKSVAEKAVPVKLVVAQQEQLQRTTTQPATVHAYFETQIRAKVAGYVKELTADIGDVVAAGDALVKLHAPELEKEVEVLRARVKLLNAQEQIAMAEVDLADASLQSAEAQLDQAFSELDSSQASLTAAQAEFSRTEDLVSRGSLQPRLLDEVTKKRDAAAAAKQAIQSAAESMKAEVAVARAEKASREAAVQSATASVEVAVRQLEQAEVMLAYTNVKAPMSGVVSKRDVEFGELVDGDLSSEHSLFTLSQVDKLRVRIPVPEICAPFVQPGDQVELRFPSFTDEAPMMATVTRRAGSLDPSTRTMIVEAEVENADGKLLPGMFGEATIRLGTKAVATMLPSRAVRFDESGRSYVYVVDESNQVQVVDVQTGQDNGSRIEIVAGLSPGDRVVGQHLKRFVDGQEVRPLR